MRAFQEYVTEDLLIRLYDMGKQRRMNEEARIKKDLETKFAMDHEKKRREARCFHRFEISALAVIGNVSLIVVQRRSARMFTLSRLPCTTRLAQSAAAPSPERLRSWCASRAGLRVPGAVADAEGQALLRAAQGRRADAAGSTTSGQRTVLVHETPGREA